MIGKIVNGIIKSNINKYVAGLALVGASAGIVGNWLSIKHGERHAQVYSADLNKDGHLDIAYVRGSKRQIFLNNGDNTYVSLRNIEKYMDIELRGRVGDIEDTLEKKLLEGIRPQVRILTPPKVPNKNADLYTLYGIYGMEDVGE